MKILFLGTGTSQGVPMIGCACNVCKSTDPKDKRLRSSILIDVDGLTIQIDGGPDFRYQHLRAGTKKLDAILITHYHKDHIGGLDDVRAFNYTMQKSANIYCEHNVAKAIRTEFAYSFHETKYPGVPEFNLIEISDEPFFINNLNIIPIRAVHYKLPVLGFRINDFCYLTDANYIDDMWKLKMMNLKCLVINGLRKDKHISHFSLGESLELIKELKPERAFITHISHQLGLHNEVEIELPFGTHLAHDMLEIVL